MSVYKSSNKYVVNSLYQKFSSFAAFDYQTSSRNPVWNKFGFKTHGNLALRQDIFFHHVHIFPNIYSIMKKSK